MIDPTFRQASKLFILQILVLFTAQNDMLVAADGSFSLTIPFKQEECLLIRVPKEPHIVSGSFDCLDTNSPTDPVRVALYDTSESLVWASEYGDAEGTFSHRGSGKHWLCLENGLTYEQKRDKPSPLKYRVARTIGFSLRLKKASGGGDGGEAKRGLSEGNKNDIDGTMTKLLQLTARLNENFQNMADHMSFMKAREIVHREIHEETFTKVVRWNILEICTVVVVTFGQVLNVWWILSNRRTY